MFAKFANAICSDGDAIVLPEGIGHVDAEAELAVVIGEVAHRVSVESRTTSSLGTRAQTM